jgi:hypothetical protein
MLSPPANLVHIRYHYKIDLVFWRKEILYIYIYIALIFKPKNWCRNTKENMKTTIFSDVRPCSQYKILDLSEESNASFVKV